MKKKQNVYLLHFKKKLLHQILKKLFLSDISNFVDESKIISFSNFKAQIIATKDIDPIEQVKKGISGIYLGECIDTLKDK